jgi:tetratricopeptide (TPR) repeat protein
MKDTALVLQHCKDDQMTTKLLLAGAALGLLVAAHPASASEYDVLIKAKKYAEAEKLADSKLAQNPANAEAMAGKTETILASGNETRIEEAIKLAEQCVAKVPASALCHVALGKAHGIKAMSGGMMAAVGSAGKIRDSFKKATELDPRNFDARFSLLQFYTMAPGFMGGGASKAESLVNETTALNPEAGKLMAAMIDLSEGRMAKAETAAAAAKPGADQELLDRHESLYASLGGKYMSDKKPADAERVLREGLKRYPDSDSLPFALARTQQEQGKYREAIAGFEQVLLKNPRPTVHYRIGQSLQAVGEKAKAIAAYEKAIGFKTGLNKKFRSDAEDQIKSLKG